MRPFRRVHVSALALLVAAAWSGPVQAQINPFGRGYSRMTAEDLRLMNAQLDRLLKSGDTGSVGAWQNAESGNYGTIEVERTFSDQGRRCKRVDHVIRVRKERDTRLLQLTYCEKAGEWKLAG